MTDPEKDPQKAANPFREAIASTEDLVECFGVTKQYIGKLAADGLIEKAGRDRWNAFDTVRQFTEHLRSRRVNQHDTGGGSIDSEADFEAARARKMIADADVAGVLADLVMGRVHEGKAVEELWTNQAFTVRSRLLGLPSGIASKMPTELAAEVLKIATEIVHQALAELSEYSPEKIAERTNKRRLFDPTPTTDDAAICAAAEVESEPVG